MFENLLLFAKLGLSVLFLLFIVRWILLQYLWFEYDKPINDLRKNLDKFRKKHRAEAIPQPFIDGRIKKETKEVNERLDILETKRRLFLDRVNLLTSLMKIDHK